MNESFRQALGAVYVCLADAAGADVLERANKSIAEALEAGCVPDEYAKTVLEVLVRNSK